MTVASFRWAISDDRLWFLHVCGSGGSDVWQAPPPWTTDGERVHPSLDCQRCGLHLFLGPDERVDQAVLDAALSIKLDALLAHTPKDNP